MLNIARQHFRLSNGAMLSFVTAGVSSNPAILLLHGFPSSSRTFRGIIPRLSEVAHVIAPDLPGFGESEPVPIPSFSTSTDAVLELLTHLRVESQYLYVHDFGAPIALEIAMRSPECVLGLIVQNANAHHSGQGPGWADTHAYWQNPTPENEAKATAHLTLDGTRDQYVADVPQDVASCIAPESWLEDWRVMQLPERMETQRRLIADYGNYTSKFDRIAEYLAEMQPPSLMVWGRHDAFFALDEILSWLKALPRMEAHILDGGHFLLETKADPVADLIAKFIAGKSGWEDAHSPSSDLPATSANGG